MNASNIFMAKMHPFCVPNPQLSSFAIFSYFRLLQIFFRIIKHALHFLGRSVLISIPNISYSNACRLSITLFLFRNYLGTPACAKFLTRQQKFDVYPCIDYMLYLKWKILIKIFILHQLLVRRAPLLIPPYISLKPKKNASLIWKIPIYMNRLSYVGDSFACNDILDLAIARLQVTEIVFLEHFLAVFWARFIVSWTTDIDVGDSFIWGRYKTFCKVFCFFIVWRAFHPTHMGIPSCLLHVRSEIHKKSLSRAFFYDSGQFQGLFSLSTRSVDDTISGFFL